MNILNPAKVLIGGDILPIVDYLLPRIREVVVVRVFDPLKAALQIEPVGLGKTRWLWAQQLWCLGSFWAEGLPSGPWGLRRHTRLNEKVMEC